MSGHEAGMNIENGENHVAKSNSIAKRETKFFNNITRKTWVRKIQARTDGVRRVFGLDPDEQLINDYMCALKKKILLQGRLFVFEKHLCFHSALFGYHKTKVIPFERIEIVQKRKNVGFPNSIEVTWKPCPPQSPASVIEAESAMQNRNETASEHLGSEVDLKKEFFTSFVSREDAYRLILGLWTSQNGLEHEQFENESLPSLKSDDEIENFNISNNDEELAEQAKKVHRDHSTFKSLKMRSGFFCRSRQTSLQGSELEQDLEDGIDESDLHISSPKTASFGNTIPDETTKPSDLIIEHDTSDTNDQNGDESKTKNEAHDGGFSKVDEVTKEQYNEGENKKAKGQVLEFEECAISNNPDAIEKEFADADEAAPQLPANMQRVLTCVLPTTSRGFYSTFLSSSSDFFVVFHEKQGHRNVKLSSWQRHYHVGPVRDLSFVTPLKGWRMGPSEALCHQTQRYQVYKGHHLVFETSQAMSDIPYSDHFKVETRWDISPGINPGTCSVTVHIAVPFTKSTMWRKFIEKSVIESSLEAYQMFTQLADAELAESATDRETLQPKQKGSPVGEKSGSKDVNYPDAPRLSPEEVMPTTNEDWELLLAQIEPQWRGGLRVLRNRYQNSNYTDALKNSDLRMRPHHKRNRSLGFRLDALEQFDPLEAKIPTPQGKRRQIFGNSNVNKDNRAITDDKDDGPSRMPSLADGIALNPYSQRSSFRNFMSATVTKIFPSFSHPTISTKYLILIFLGIQIVFIGLQVYAILNESHVLMNWRGSRTSLASLHHQVESLSAQAARLQKDINGWKYEIENLLNAVHDLVEQVQDH